MGRVDVDGADAAVAVGEAVRYDRVCCRIDDGGRVGEAGGDVGGGMRDSGGAEDLERSSDGEGEEREERTYSFHVL